MLFKRILSAMKNFILRFGFSKSKNCDAVDASILKEYVNIFKSILKKLEKTTDPQMFSNCFNNLKTLYFKIGELDISGCFSTTALKHIEDMTYKSLGDDNKDICYFVTFGGKSKKYCYLSNGTRYRVGQYVIVPVGDALERKIAKITKRKTIKNKKNLKTIIQSAI